MLIKKKNIDVKNLTVQNNYKELNFFSTKIFIHSFRATVIVRWKLRAPITYYFPP
jgi:hypothetical protein